MTLAASSQRSQIIRSKFRSVLQLRIHRRYQDPSLSGSFATSPVSDPDPWISATDSALAPAPASPSARAPFLFSPGVLLPEPKHCPWRSLKESPKISQHWREPKLKGNLTYHQYMPPEPRQRSRADPGAEGSALGRPGPPPWEGTNSQQPPPRMKPTRLTPSPVGVPSPSSPPHKLELQTLKLEELTFKQCPTSHSLPASRAAETLETALAPPPALAPAPAPTATTAQTPASVPIPSSAPASTALTLEEELQEAIRRAQLLPNRGIDDILEDQVEPEDPLPPIPLDFPGSFDVLSPSPDSEGLSSVFSSSLPSPTNTLSPSPRDPTDSLDWLEALSGGPPLGCGPPAPSIFSADLSDSSGTRLWDLLEDPW
ncbi:MEF2-activating motif and SAP domain-containing transcriptional regulator isoform X3 [Hippopotamus amphibius kiboko]|uniref:MEF2-activating motif and SAP domain-containing transcriptional regulator isoform X3 n=1 Tax=Hippopotamus amphibius kiboko TaxID=575201 RepID=UPI002598D52E|nr:MEF2-activating motif and SAP domain-containing transcriptional regulator isoform X3 [Hippopotamus amphibius kiboko]